MKKIIIRKRKKLHRSLCSGRRNANLLLSNILVVALLINSIHDSQKILFEKTNVNKFGRKNIFWRKMEKFGSIKRNTENLETSRGPQKLVERGALRAALF